MLNHWMVNFIFCYFDAGLVKRKEMQQYLGDRSTSTGVLGRHSVRFQLQEYLGDIWGPLLGTLVFSEAELPPCGEEEETPFPNDHDESHCKC